MVKRFLHYVIMAFLTFLGSIAQAQPVELALADLDGREHALSDYRGQWVVVNYWAIWCIPCLEELPELVLFQDKHRDSGFQVIGVNYEEAPLEKVRAFIDENRISFPIWLASPDEPSPLGRILGLPSTFIVSPAGEVVFVHQGKVTQAVLEQAIAKAGARDLGPTNNPSDQ